MIRLAYNDDVDKIIELASLNKVELDFEYVKSLIDNNTEYIYVSSIENSLNGAIICFNDGEYINIKKILIKDNEDEKEISEQLIRHLVFNANLDLLIEINEDDLLYLNVLENQGFKIYETHDEMLVLKKIYQNIIVENMEVFNYFDQDEEFKKVLLEQINEPLWVGAKHLYERLKEHSQQGKVYIMYDKDKSHIITFATYHDFDEIESDELKPWIGSLYTFRVYRGNRYSQKLIKYILEDAKKEGNKFVYISSDNIGMYEKFGFEFIGMMETVRGNKTQVFKYDLDKLDD